MKFSGKYMRVMRVIKDDGESIIAEIGKTDAFSYTVAPLPGESPATFFVFVYVRMVDGKPEVWDPFA